VPIFISIKNVNHRLIRFYRNLLKTRLVLFAKKKSSSLFKR
jgi:hypothetical protein